MDKDGGGPALLVVDVQRDFCAGGALAVPGGDAVVPPLNDLIARFAAAGRPIYFSRDWHPPETTHFQDRGGRWPVHCVADTSGAAFHPDLLLPPTALIVTKGDSPTADGYSAFDGRTPAGTGLRADLAQRGVLTLVVGGLATDYCVQHSVLDALRAGLNVTVVRDAIAGVNLNPGDSVAALEAMRDAGARFAPSDGVTP